MSDQLLQSDLAKMPAKGESIYGPRRWRLWLLLVLMTMIGTGTALLYWPVLTIADVVYEGPAQWESQVRSLVTLPSDGNILHFVPADAEAQIESRFSERGDVQVRIELPGRIAITMTPFQPRLWGDGEIGITRDGSLLIEPATHPDLPRWNPGIDWEGSMPLAERAKRAAGTWDELNRADGRYAIITSTWECDPTYGWTSTAADGKTRLVLGNTMIEERASAIALLLDQGDTLLAGPCQIDARFEGQLLLSKLPEVHPDTSMADTNVVRVTEMVPVATRDTNISQTRQSKGRT